MIGVYVRPGAAAPEYAAIEARQELLSILSKWDEKQGELETESERLFAWNGTREAKRALADSLPLLRQAGKVIVIGINTGDGEHIAGADACAHLARHGVNAEPRHILTSPADSDSASLPSAVRDSGAGLLVMGAYGHHRMRELLLGGMTRDLLRRMTVPVLMSH